MFFPGEAGGACVDGPDDEKQASEDESCEEKFGGGEARLWIADDLGEQWLEQNAANHKDVTSE